MSFVIAALASIVIMIAFTGIGGRTITGIVILLGLTGGLLNARLPSTSTEGDERQPRKRHNVIRIGGIPAPSGTKIDA
jgi:hypothetical protein